MNNYELPLSRARALYTIPTIPKRARALELCGAREPLFRNADWRGEHCQVCVLDGKPGQSGELHADPASALPFAPGSFDLVILHKTLDDLSFAAHRSGSSFNALDFLVGVQKLVAPGGVVAGTLSNWSSPKRLASAARRNKTQLDAASFFTLLSCRTLVENSGLADVRLFSVLPNWQSPLRLVEAERCLARIAFTHELERRRSELSKLGFWARKLAVSCGLYLHLEDSIFFWGYKPA